MITSHDIAEIIERETSQDRFSGAVLSIQEGQALFQRAYGLASRSWEIENTLDTRFRIASISKMFTAAAILQLIEAGKFDFDTKIVQLLDMKNSHIPAEVTVYHLLTMTSGIADWFDESGDWEANWTALIREHPIYLFRDNQDYLPLFMDEPPPSGVGEKYKYNGAGYILLGLVIENISGRPYTEWIEQRIFTTADMDKSGFFALDGVYENVAEGYMRTEEASGANAKAVWTKNIYSTTPNAAADGGATSTVGDLYKFSRALREGELLNTDLTRAIQTPQVRSLDKRLRGYTWKYGFGNMFLLDDNDEVVRWGHTGEEDGVSCRLYYYPKQDLDVVILANQSWCTVDLGWEFHNLITAES